MPMIWLKRSKPCQIYIRMPTSPFLHRAQVSVTMDSSQYVPSTGGSTLEIAKYATTLFYDTRVTEEMVLDKFFFLIRRKMT